MFVDLYRYMSTKPAAWEIRQGYPGQQQYPVVPTGKHVRKDGGKADGGKDVLSPEKERRWNEKVVEYFGGLDTDLARWIETGDRSLLQ